MYTITEEDIQWIKRYIETPSPSGNERKGQELWLNYIKPFVDDTFDDVYGNVVGIINPQEKIKVVIEAHADEIAWYVHTISKNGFIHVAKTGGTDAGVAPSQRVYIHTDQGLVEGIFGWPAIHTRPGAGPTPTESTVFIDCGCSSKKEVEDLGVQVGDLITYQCALSILNKNYFVGRAQDNRMGGFIIATVVRLIRQHRVTLPYTLYIVNSVQEENGLRGAGMIAHTLKPDCAIVTDANHATDIPMVKKNEAGNIELGKGPSIIKAPPVHSVLRRLLMNAAKENEIPFQLAVSSKKTGTDADSFAYTLGGIPSCLLSLPLRYMHTTVETSHRNDIENLIWLMYQSLQRITPEMNFKLLGRK